MQIPAVNVDFVGMSLYFFVVDFVRAAFRLSEDAQLSIEELKSYGRAFCALPWEFRRGGSLIFRDVKNRFRGVHPYTNEQVLPQRCFQIAYVVTLLEQGYRLEEGEQNAVSIDFLRKINGESVDWTYGAALFMVVPRQISLKWILATIVALCFECEIVDEG
ncbi:LOW QUALITY PROTEIN: uncharacterized protein [Blastocystis hominis]|uniref:Uncharacterized protein n=1 Tax=Blastocystis hominis TaxID=12968 RepID=D8LZ51_BLAHO|nr:LOW QUALITY PROTEIN: uncharacterized protein [Blastocystis hominis]CBK21090.2 unnamed protein product [Blastocystis hominis]|eukprot:XP_012895138.1 LOW QUALITY PROTEIN: uncharacterized protein [Blastocystis hominis]